jgi:hypothetical protein
VLPQAVSEHYRAQQRLIVATLGLTRAEWSRMGGDFDASWARVGPRILLLTASAQLGAARSGAAYVPDTLAELGTPVDPVGEVVPGAFSGVASDGRPLDTLLAESVIQAKQRVAGGASQQEALAAAGKALDMYVHTQVADAARGAASVSIASRNRVGWVRMVNPPCCSRCAILAGRFYAWSSGFQRHPRCDCTMTPSREDRAHEVDTWTPQQLFDGGHVKGLRDVQAKAIADGADPIAVMNADRRVFVNGKYVSKTQGIYTTAAVGRARGQARRLSPEGVYRIASDREEALKLLRANGYLR